MSEITKSESTYFKVEDLAHEWESMVIRATGMSKYEDGQPSYDLYFYEHPKPLGLNITNRRMLESIVGDVDFSTAALHGLRLELFKEWTQDRAGKPCQGVRIRPVANSVQADSSQARERINAAQQMRQDGPPRVPSSQPPYRQPYAGEPRREQPPARYPDPAPQAMRHAEPQFRQDGRTPPDEYDSQDPGPASSDYEQEPHF